MEMKNFKLYNGRTWPTGWLLLFLLFLNPSIDNVHPPLAGVRLDRIHLEETHTVFQPQRLIRAPFAGRIQASDQAGQLQICPTDGNGPCELLSGVERLHVSIGTKVVAGEVIGIRSQSLLKSEDGE